MAEMVKNSGGVLSQLEKIRSYVDKTRLTDRVKDNYALKLAEVQAFYGEADTNLYNAITDAFRYGMAKGYRAARAEARR